MLTPDDRRAHYAEVQDGFRRRQRNLRRIIEALGGWQAASRRTGKAIAKLHQLADLDHPWHQSIGDRMARELEYVLRLKPGALDSREADPPRIPRVSPVGPGKS